jgi:hypothetical protein
MLSEVNCPYCDAQQEINHDDGYGYYEGHTYKQECLKCEKTFVYTTTLVLYYETYKADCLNGSEHEWEPTKTFPICLKRMRCKLCDEKRDMTKEEKVFFEIPTINEYIQSLNEI